MDIKRFVTTRAVVWLVLGLLGGAIAADVLWRHHTGKLEEHLKELRASAEAERSRAASAASQLSAAGAELKRLKEDVERLTQQVKSERELRHQYEDLVSRGQK